MTDADNLRLFSPPPRTNDLIPITVQIFTEIIRQLFEVGSDTLASCVGQELQAGFQPMNQRRGGSASFPGQRPVIPPLFEVLVILRIGNTDPAYQRGLDSFTGSIGKVEQ